MHMISSNLLKNELISKSAQQRQREQHIINHSSISTKSEKESHDKFFLLEISVHLLTLTETNITSIISQLYNSHKLIQEVEN